MIEHMVPSLSTYSADIDFVINLVGVIVGFWFVVTELMFFWLLWKFRAQEGKPARYITGKEKDLKRWISVPHGLIIFLDIFIIIAAVQVWVKVKMDLPEPDATIRIVSQQWAWSFVHPGPDGELDTADDIKTVDEFHVEVNKTYHFELESRDVLHSFSVPVWRIKQDAIPGRVIKGWFEPTGTGTFDVQCVEICGIGHGIMAGRVVVETSEQHQSWIERNTPTNI